MTDEEALAKAKQAFNDARTGAGNSATDNEILSEVRRKQRQDPELFEAMRQTGLMMLRAQQGH